jgi:hypothetical protein
VRVRIAGSIRQAFAIFCEIQIPLSPMKFFTKSSPPRTLRFTLLDLHSTGVVSVFRRHSFFRVWVPLRETHGGTENFVS